MYSPAQLVKKYMHYYLAAHNSKGHGIHSPFVFDFIKFVKNDQKQYGCYQPIEGLRSSLLKNKNHIEVEDFGAGSTLLKTKSRRIDQMAASSLKPRKFAQLLYRMVKYYQPHTILELGTSFGITSAYLASGNPASVLYTMEGAARVASIASGNFDELNLKNITLLKGDFTQMLPELLPKIEKIDFAFVDGNHKRTPTLNYFEQLLRKVGPESILVFDDIHWSDEMEAAWDEIQRHPSVTLTIDLFFIGIVFLSPSFKVKQHFSLRF